MVRQVETLEEFNAILKEAGDKLVVVDFTASWCGPCKQIGPHFEELSNKAENKNVIFLKVDVDDAQDVATKWEIRAMPTFIFIKNGKKEVSEHCGIQCMPTFMFFKNGSKVFEFSGANQDTLTEKVVEFRT